MADRVDGMFSTVYCSQARSSFLQKSVICWTLRFVMNPMMLRSFAVLIIAGTFVCFCDPTLAPVTVESRSFRGMVRETFLTGVGALENLAESLLSANITGRIYRRIQSHIGEAHTNLRKAEGMALNKETELRAQRATLMTELRRLAEQQHALQLQVNGTSTELDILRDLRNRSRIELQRGKQNLEYSKADLEKMKKEKAALEADRDKGKGIFASTSKVVGLSMITASLEALELAQKKADEANRSVHAQVATIDTYSAKVKSCKTKIRDIQVNISNIQGKMNTIEAKIAQENNFLKKLTDFQLPVGQCRAFLSVMVGKNRTENVRATLSAMVDVLLPTFADMTHFVSPLIGNNDQFKKILSSRLGVITEKMNQANGQFKNMSLSTQADDIRDFL
ncbi:hypothetical protein NDU88_000503 [Pleurodeles waltl]|uniref:Uncharacterized protein n=1 Tax=Pleurodeles waltl TaxID=8319 RepID=A0AAV7WLK4_PLEWA|nr:hypothetical protein NDU88_000503 [Pleurodeles waltl]